MSKYAAPDQIKIPPRSNVYTVLAAIGFVVTALGIYLLISKAKELMPPGIM